MTSNVLTNAEKIRRLHWNTGLNAANSVFTLLTYFGPGYVLFLNELHFTNTQIGLLLSFLPFTGLVALLIAPMVARFGYKRTFVTFFALRKVMTAGFLFVPAIIASSSQDVLFAYVAFIVGGFALFRAIAETGMYPWAQEFIPNSIRGRYSAVNDIAGRLSGIATTALASAILGLPLGLDRFMLMFAIGLVFGFISVWSATHIPGGAPIRGEQDNQVSYRHFADVMRDPNFVFYLAAIGILTIGVTPMGSFLPLYMEQQVGLNESLIVLLQIGSLTGGLAATYLVGWAADRYGSKPVMFSGLSARMILPLAWMLIPRQSDLSLPAALLISLVGGVAEVAWLIGSARLLYVKVVPQEKSGDYMAVYYAAIGLIGGLSQVFGGQLLDFTGGLSGQFLVFTIDPFFPLFVLAFAFTGVSIALFRRVQGDSPVSLGEFAGMFVHGNPVLALESLVRYYRARDERETVVMTERMGQTKSPLTVDELLDSLKDPRFNVRFEAIISIARMDSDPRLVEALCNILEGTEISLSVIAAWALGRMGDERATLTLRHGLDSPYRSIQAHCARSLGTLRDTSVAPLLLERLKAETDKGLRIAYSSALGNLKAIPAVGTLLDHLYTTENEGARLEISLALARIVSGEHHFIRLLRNIRQDKGTAASQALTALKRRFHVSDELVTLIDQCADTFAREQFDEAARLLAALIRQFPPELHTDYANAILAECAKRFEETGSSRGEYLLLALHTLEMGHR